MGVVIESTGLGRNAISATQNCLRKIGLPIEEIGLLINAGVYREDNIVEPAISALLQKELGLNLDYVKDNTGKSTFSFDLMNGACGVLNAVQVAQACLQSSSVKKALIICGNSHPRYASLGAALLLGVSDDPNKGFSQVYTRASIDGFYGIRGYTKLYQQHSRQKVIFEEETNYESRLMAFMASCVKSFRTPDVTFIAPQKLGQKLEINCIDTSHEGQDSHVSGPIVGYEMASESQKQRPLLFVAGGAGLSAAWALYR